MPTRVLPARANLEHLKHEAKGLLKAFQAGDADAAARIHATLGTLQTLKLSDAQRALAREYGFSTWARLRAQVQASRGLDDAIAAFLDAVADGDADRAKLAFDAHPAIARASVHVAAVLGDEETVARLIAQDRTRVTERVGRFGGDPLLYLAYSPFQGESSERDAGLLATARILLDAGADPNTHDAIYHVPALFAVTAQRTVLPIARLLIGAGANPTDGESLHHSAERFREEALEFLLAAGADVDGQGEWGNTPLYFLLRWYDVEHNATVRRGVVWLLEHGADPNVRCGKEERETSLHLAARVGQQPAVIRLLLSHAADVHARRADGRTPWMLAARGGFDETLKLLEAAGAKSEPLSPADQLLAACGRGDATAARTLATPEVLQSLDRVDVMLLPHAAATFRERAILACIAAGFPIDAVDETGATALHHAALRGRVTWIRALLAAGASVDIRDKEHSATPLGWADFGSHHIRDEEGDYPACIRALTDAGGQ